MRRAFAAGAEGRYQREAILWRTAISFEADGRFLTLKSFLLARAERNAGNWPAVIDACNEVIYPRALTDWGWSALTGRCLVWSGEAASELGRIEQARL